MPLSTTTFDDIVGEVSGTWVLGRKLATEPGLIISIMVADAGTACAAIVVAGGEITQPVNPDAAEITAWFPRDPAGNVMGIYEQRGLVGADSTS